MPPSRVSFCSFFSTVFDTSFWLKSPSSSHFLVSEIKITNVQENMLPSKQGLDRDRKMVASLLGVYTHVLEDVIKNVHDDFQRESSHANALNELKMLWELKMRQAESVKSMAVENSSDAEAQKEISSSLLEIPYKATEKYDKHGTGPKLHLVAALKAPASYQYIPPETSELDRSGEASFSANVKVDKPELCMDGKIGNDLKVPNLFQRTNESSRESSISSFITKDGIPQLDGGKDEYANNIVKEEYNELGDEGESKQE